MNHSIEMIWDSWSQGMLRASWHGAAAVVIAWALCRLLPGLPAAVKCWVWRVAYLKLVLALFWIGPIEVPVLRPASPPRIAAAVVAPASADPVEAERVPAFTSQVGRVPDAEPPFDWRWATMGIWLAGVLGYAIVIALRWNAAARDRRGCEAAQCGELLDAYQRVCRLCGVARAPPLMICTDGGSPRLLGLLRPAIILPARLLDSTPPAQLELLLAHELAHHQRRDLWWSWLAILGRALFWFHPAVWVAERQWKLSEEIACDQAAITALNARAGTYARMLLEVASRYGQSIGSPAAVGVVESAKTLERRLLAMRHIPVWSRSRRLSFGLAVTFAAAIAIVPWRLVAQQREGDTDRTESGADTAAAAAPSSRPAIHPPLHTREEMDRVGANHNTAHGTWLYDNVVMGKIECPFADVAASSPGTIVDVHCAEGQAVKQGDPLFALDDARARASLLEAEAEFKKADINYQRLEAVKKSNAVSPSDVDTAAADRDIAAARLAIAKRDLDQTRIRCPMSGVVTRCLTAAGQVVNRGDLLAQIMNVQKLSVAFEVDSAQYPYLRAGQKVRVLSDHAADQPLLATISFVSPVVHDVLGRSGVKATIEDADHRPRPGSAVKVDLQLYREEDLPH